MSNVIPFRRRRSITIRIEADESAIGKALTDAIKEGLRREPPPFVLPPSLTGRHWGVISFVPGPCVIDIDDLEGDGAETD